MITFLSQIQDGGRRLTAKLLNHNNSQPWIVRFRWNLVDWSMASPGLVSGRQLTVSPHFFPRKELTTFFRHHRRQLYASIFSNWRPFLLITVTFIHFTRASPPSPPGGCHPALFLHVRLYFSTVLCKFSHIFSLGCHPPGGCHPGRSAPRPLVKSLTTKPLASPLATRLKFCRLLWCLFCRVLHGTERGTLHQATPTGRYLRRTSSSHLSAVPQLPRRSSAHQTEAYLDPRQRAAAWWMVAPHSEWSRKHLLRQRDRQRHPDWNIRQTSETAPTSNRFTTLSHCLR